MLSNRHPDGGRHDNPATRAGHGTRSVLAGLVLALVLAACGEAGSGPAAVAHPWINPPPAQRDSKSVALEPFLIYRVDEQRLAEATDTLKAEPYIQISPSMAVHYTGSDVRVPAEMRPFLIRAVAAPQADITVIQSMEGLWAHASGGSGSPAATPLVVLIDPTPQKIYVTAE